MITGRTSQGFEFIVDPRILSEWKFVKAIKRSESLDDGQKLLGVIDLITMLLGEEQEGKLSEFIAERNDGFASVDNMYAAVVEILTICNEKNKEAKK